MHVGQAVRPAGARRVGKILQVAGRFVLLSHDRLRFSVAFPFAFPAMLRLLGRDPQPRIMEPGIPRNGYTMRWKRLLFECNRRGSPHQDGILQHEANWAIGLIEAATPTADTIDQFNGFKRQLQQALDDDAVWSENEQYLAGSCTRIELASVVGHYAIDGLTEAQAMFYFVPRVPAKVQMPLMRVLIDEFG